MNTSGSLVPDYWQQIQFVPGRDKQSRRSARSTSTFHPLWDWCFWQRAVLGWRGPFVPQQLAASREVQRATGPQVCIHVCVCVCVYLCVRRPWQQYCEAAPSHTHMPALVSLLPRSHEQGPQSTWPAKLPPHMGLLEAHTLACHATSPGLCGDNADQSLQELLTPNSTIG